MYYVCSMYVVCMLCTYIYIYIRMLYNVVYAVYVLCVCCICCRSSICRCVMMYMDYEWTWVIAAGLQKIRAMTHQLPQPRYYENFRADLI